VEIGMQLTWVVRNIVDFWAFIDIGLKNDALLHKSQCGQRVEHLFEIFGIGQQLDVYVKDIDTQRKRIWLCIRSSEQSSVPLKAKPTSKNTSTRRKPTKETPSEHTMWWNISFS
jgi:transcriptional accessory protein Tex/SPT6